MGCCRTLISMKAANTRCFNLAKPENNDGSQLPEADLRSTYSRHAARTFSQDRTVVNLGRPSPATRSGEKLRPIDETEFPARASTYDTSKEDEQSKNEVDVAQFTSNKEFGVPGRYEASAKDRTSLLRSAHIAQEPFVNLKPKTQEFGLLKYVSSFHTKAAALIVPQAPLQENKRKGKIQSRKTSPHNLRKSRF